MKKLHAVYLLFLCGFSFGQANLSDYVKSYLAFDNRKIALEYANLITGISDSLLVNQTLLIDNGIIEAIGLSDTLHIPDQYLRLDLKGSTIIPGMVGTHNHMRLPQGALLFTSPRLYLASGVTTIQTCGTGNPEEELVLAQAIEEGNEVGPYIVNSSPYFTGPDGKSNFIRFTTEQTVRDTIAYWASRGVEWFKVYRHTRPQDLKVIVEEAHRWGAKVTGHLCATTFEEAAMMNIDAIEHGFIHSYDHATEHTSGVCTSSSSFRSSTAIHSKEVERIQQILIDKGVALSTTPSILEAQVSARAHADDRTLKALSPYHVEAYYDRRKRMDEKGDNWYFQSEWLTQSLAYDLLFLKRGGLLTAGPDPGLHNLPGFGDQRNYQLLVEAGFTPAEAISVMTYNGSKLLGYNQIGSIEPGKQADLVVLKGDLTSDPSVIEKVTYTIKGGWVYDPSKLLADTKGHVGSTNDDYMTYLGRRTPGVIPEMVAPGFISTPDGHEFGSVFSDDGTSFFFGMDIAGKAEIRHTKLVSGVWSLPITLLADSVTSFNDPFLTPDEENLFFISDLPRENGSHDYDIWYIRREGNQWSDPVNAGPEINSDANEFYMSFTEDQTMYFSSNRSGNFDIYRAAWKNGNYQPAERLPFPINSQSYEADVFIAPDESYMIFCSIKDDGYGEGDLYISFNDGTGGWSVPKSMGDKINTSEHELCPYVAKDGKYFLFTRGGDIYWVDSAIIETLR